jgi:hypothetical protein
VEFFVDIGFGTDKANLQTFTVKVDTGSPGTWVPHKGCKSYAKNRKNCLDTAGNNPPAGAKVYDSTGKTLEPGFLVQYSTVYTMSGV